MFNGIARNIRKNAALVGFAALSFGTFSGCKKEPANDTINPKYDFPEYISERATKIYIGERAPGSVEGVAVYYNGQGVSVSIDNGITRNTGNNAIVTFEHCCNGLFSGADNYTAVPLDWADAAVEVTGMSDNVVTINYLQSPMVQTPKMTYTAATMGATFSIDKTTKVWVGFFDRNRRDKFLELSKDDQIAYLQQEFFDNGIKAGQVPGMEDGAFRASSVFRVE